MGAIIYGGGERRVELDDRTLAHVKSVVVTKLRRQESFTLSCIEGLGDDSHRSSLWIHPSIPLEFEFTDPDRPELNRAWLNALMVSTNGSGDLWVDPEPDAEPGVTAA
ncbi:DUF7882 family protein [Microterricola pindariensis]|uniref:DUF7882 domain-containing protein n=3 Tax=Microterricola TaxID=518733 RepID=A0A1H1ZBW0_9MICO|nr:hypothetical protein [Microterricola pindariensis]PPL19921.1 hypothetical protein GY24_03130 [Microterricola pindariensis]SDT31047.1 hypothetical protein SAMN04489834_3394 [Microterricola viridarii]